MSLLQTIHLTKSYVDGQNTVDVLRDVNLSLEKGEMCSIIGASGSGKTTLLQICGTLASPSSGKLLFNKKELQTLSEKEKARFRNQSLGFIFQFHHLLPEFTTLENVLMPGLIAGKRRGQLEERAKELLAAVELDHRMDNKVTTLSGGEQQRTALARALMLNPELLLADEPTGNLDNRAGTLVFKLLKKLSRQFDMGVIMVTHNLELARQMDSVTTLVDGTLKPQPRS